VRTDRAPGPLLRATVAAALKFAENSPWPDASQLANEVYA